MLESGVVARIPFLAGATVIRLWHRAVGEARRAVQDVGSTEARALPGAAQDWTPVGGS